MKGLAALYREFVAAAGARACRVEDLHAGRWWPGYAVRAVRHREAGKPCDCKDCRRATKEGYLPCA